MFIIEQAHWIATHEIILQARTHDKSTGKRQGLLHEGPDVVGLEWKGDGGGEEKEEEKYERESASEGPIVATPMGIVRPWPRMHLEASRMAGLVVMDGATPEHGESSAWDDGQLSSVGGRGGGGAEGGGRGEPVTRSGGGGGGPRVSGDVRPPVRDGDATDSGRRGLTSDAVSMVTETPMGTVRPTSMWWLPSEKDRSGGDTTTALYAEPGVRGEAGTAMPDEGRPIEPPVGVRRSRTETHGDGGTQSGEGPVKGISEKASGPREGQPSTKTRGDNDSLRNGTFNASSSSSSRQIADNSFWTGEHHRRPETSPAIKTDLLVHRRRIFSKSEESAAAAAASSSPPSPPPPPPAEPSAAPNELSNITTLTLLTEDVPRLTAFYITVLGAAAAAAVTATPPWTTTLAFTPHLSVTLIDSTVARNRAVFGDDVLVGRHEAVPKRVMLGVEVRDVDAVWRRLRGVGHGAALDDGQEVLGEVRVVAGRKSVCFVDLAGHCWEAWQEAWSGKIGSW